MSRFTKNVRQLSNTYVEATIIDTATGSQVAYDAWIFPFQSQESKFKSAHAWADKRIATLEKYTTPVLGGAQ